MPVEPIAPALILKELRGWAGEDERGGEPIKAAEVLVWAAAEFIKFEVDWAVEIDWEAEIGEQEIVGEAEEIVRDLDRRINWQNNPIHAIDKRVEGEQHFQEQLHLGLPRDDLEAALIDAGQEEWWACVRGEFDGWLHGEVRVECKGVSGARGVLDAADEIASIAPWQIKGEG